MSDNMKFSIASKVETIDGKLSGSGKLKLEMNLTELSFGMNYKSENEVILSIDAKHGVKISSDLTLALSGGLNYDLSKCSFDGNVGLKLVINKSIAAELKQTYSDKNKTTFEIEINF